MKLAPYQPNPKSVLLVTEALARGGAERQMVNLAQGLLAEGYQVALVELLELAPGQPSFYAEMNALNVASYRPASFTSSRISHSETVPLNHFSGLLPSGYPEIAAGLRAAIDVLRPSVVYCWSDLSNVLGGCISVSAGVPVIVLGLRVMPAPNWFPADQAELYRAAYTSLLGNPSVTTICNCVTGARAYETWLSLSPGQVHVVHSAYQPLDTSADRTLVRKNYRATAGIPDDALVICGALRLSAEKEPALWIETAGMVSFLHAGTHFILAGHGHGDIPDALFKRATELGYHERLFMPGAVTNVADIYAASDALLLTSRTETLPNVIIEAQAVGLPIVAADVGGVAETLLEGSTGILVRERSPKAFADALLRIFQTNGFAEGAARLGPDFVKRKFGFARMITETTGIFNQTLRQ